VKGYGGGDRPGALASYRRVLGEFAARKCNSSRDFKTEVAVRRLGG
jgi:hypothetical protein